MSPEGLRLLVGGDFHLGPLCHAFERRLTGTSRLPLFLGDLVNRPRDDATAYHRILERWRGLAPALVVVPGNHDPEDDGPSGGVRIHRRRGLTILAIPFIPLMAAIPTWTHEVAESHLADLLAPYRGRRFDLVASHAPMAGILDHSSFGRPLGSTALRDFAGQIDFDLWICGHAHEERGRWARIGGRTVVNVARTVLDIEYRNGDWKTATLAPSPPTG